MPLFYFLSGIFYKDCNWQELVRKKYKSLLVPFFMFYFFTSIIIPIILNEEFGFVMKYYENLGVCDLLFSFVTTEIFPNPPIWFLLSLFEVAFLFCIIRYIRNNVIQYLLIFFIALIGIGCYIFDFNIDGYLDTSFTALPFYAAAFYIFKNPCWKERFLKQNYRILLFGLVFMLAITRYVHFDYRINHYIPVGLIYLLGFLGTFLVIQVSEKLRKVNIINLFGKNSLTVLCTHFMIVDFIQYFVDCVWGSNSHFNKIFAILVFIVTMLIEYFLIIPNKELPRKCFNKVIDIVYAKN